MNELDRLVTKYLFAGESAAYSRDIKAAWRVMELLKDTYEIYLSAPNEDYPEWAILLIHYDSKLEYSSTGETAEEAICLAALQPFLGTE